MKKTVILKISGYFALFLSSCFNLTNSIAEKEIFPLYVTGPLLAIAIVGIVCDIVLLVKNKGKTVPLVDKKDKKEDEKEDGE